MPLKNSALKSPFLKAREELHYTQQELADAVGVSRNFVVRAESGEYPKPPTILLDFLCGGDENLKHDLISNYRAYQAESRHNALGLLDESMTWDPYDPYLRASRSHPLMEWIYTSEHSSARHLNEIAVHITVYEVCKNLCVHQAVIHRWVADPKTVKNVPKIFLAALFEAGYNESLLINLTEAYQSYRRSLLA